MVLVTPPQQTPLEPHQWNAAAGSAVLLVLRWLLLGLLGMMVQHQNQALVEVQATLETMGNCF